MKKLLIGCLIALIIGNLTGCTNKKVNREINTTTDEISETQETNKIEEYQSECVTVNYKNEGFYQYKIIKYDQDKIEEIKKNNKTSPINTLITLKFPNGDEFDGFETKYGQNGEHSYITMANGKKIEFYNVLERKYIKPVEPEEMFDEDYRERCFKIYCKGLNLSLTVKAIKCTEEEIQYIEKTKSENYNKISITDESNNNFEGIIGRYGDTGEEIYFTNSISYPCYFKVIE